MDDARDDPQMVASGALVPIDDPRAGAALTVASPLWLEDVAKVAPRFPPELGEHSSGDPPRAGYGEAEIDALIAARVVVQGKSVVLRLVSGGGGKGSGVEEALQFRLSWADRVPRCLKDQVFPETALPLLSSSGGGPKGCCVNFFDTTEHSC